MVVVAVSQPVHECAVGADDLVQLTAKNAHVLLEVLREAEGHLRAVDESNARANLAEVRLRPLTRAVSAARIALDLEIHGGALTE